MEKLEPRIECPNLTFYKNLGFAMTKDMKQITSPEELEGFCNNCDEVRTCGKQNLMSALLAIRKEDTTTRFSNNSLN